MADPNVVQQAPDILAVAVYYFPKIASIDIAPLLLGAKKVYDLAVSIRDALVEQNQLIRQGNEERRTQTRAVIENKP